MAARQLGGSTLMLTGNEMQLAREETIADTARVISRYVDAVMIRLLDHEMVEELAANATIPVINGLTKWSHPCQVMADVMTYEEHKGPIAGATVCLERRRQQCADQLGSCGGEVRFQAERRQPARNCRPIRRLRDWAQAQQACRLRHRSPKPRWRAPIAWSPTPGSRWATTTPPSGSNLLKPYQVNGALMRLAKKDAIFMHCLPAHRGEEVTDEVIDGPQSVVFDEAENRLHVQKAILAWALVLKSAVVRAI